MTAPPSRIVTSGEQGGLADRGGLVVVDPGAVVATDGCTAVDRFDMLIRAGACAGGRINGARGATLWTKGLTDVDHALAPGDCSMSDRLFERAHRPTARHIVSGTLPAIGGLARVGRHR
jgi:hypothetical protein